MTANTKAGRTFAALMVFGQTRFTPTHRISTLPTSEMLSSAAVVITGAMSLAHTVKKPWKTPTEMAENMQPLPIEAVIMIMIMKSSIAFVNNVL